MMKKSGTTLRRILCFLLCIAMLPLVKASAAGYSSAYQAMIKWAKQGEYAEGSEPDMGKYKGWGREIEINYNEGFAVVYQDAVDPGKQDRLILAYVRAYSDNSVCITEIILTPTSDKSAMVVMISGSDREDGNMDSHGNYAGVVSGTMLTDRTLEDGLDINYFDAPVSLNRIRSDCRKELKKILEYTDKILQEDSDLSIQDIFKRISPKSLHNFSKNWVEKAETCTADGTMGYQCSACGVKYYEPIKAHHNWQLVEEIVPATDVHGSGLYKCNRCGETKVDDICISGAFTDMPAYDNWAHPGIDWAVFKGITNGTSSTTFSPGQGCTRGQVVTFLWRAAGSPEPESMETPFQDLKPGAFYEKAVAWAVEQEITSGISQTQFSPDGTCTRGQIVTFLWRFKGSPEVSEVNTNFHDVKLGAFYEKAVGWAASTGVTSGTSETTFSPDNTCTRAQVVTFLHRAQ